MERPVGGFCMKIHLQAGHDRLPIAFELFEGKPSNTPLFVCLLDDKLDAWPRVVIADKASDGDTIGTDEEAIRLTFDDHDGRTGCPIVRMQIETLSQLGD